MSEVSTSRFVDRVRAAGIPGRILYISDFDPAGRSMPVADARKIEFELHQSGDALDITLDPLVLTEDQCRDYRLPRTPLKETERRAAKFEDRFGAGATELDALEALHPGQLERIIKAGMERYLDPDHPRRFASAAEEYRTALARISAKVHDRHAEEVDALRADYEELVERSRTWRQRAGVVFEGIAEDLHETTVPPFIAPEATPRPAAPEPLFDSSRSYLEQIEHYRFWQGKGEA
jgi:phage/plasmid-associated DNA primase